MQKIVDVKLQASRDKDNPKEWWVCVTATPKASEAEQVEAVQILYYQYGFMGDIRGTVFEPYEMKNGESYGWGMEYGDIVMILVRYHDKRYGEQIAAQGFWWSDGECLRSGQTLRGRSELFA